MIKFIPPLSYYTDSDKKPLLFHLLNVGEGLMILIIFPDETTLLYDCNITQDNCNRILNYLKTHIPYRYDYNDKNYKQWIDIFVNSHRDQDHYRGLSEVDKLFNIKSIWDSGQTGEATQDNDYQFYMNLRRELIRKYGEDAVIVPVPSPRPIANFENVDVYCLCSSQEFNTEISREKLAKAFEKAAKIQHTNAIVLSIRYAGRSILLTSDSDWKAWKEKIVPNFKNTGLLRSNILVASHHGSRSFFTDEENEKIDPKNNPDTTYIDSIYYIKPSITLISCGKYDQFHHPNKEALEIYKNHTFNKQVYTTNEKGTLAGFIDIHGNWTIVPIRFFPKSSKGIGRFDIECIVNYNNKRYSARSNDRFPIGSHLEFRVQAQGGLLDPYRTLEVWWEVSNGGIKEHHEYQDIYYKKINERGSKLEFYREVVYHGKHLLRCRVRNKKKKIDITKIFIVNGYPV